MNEVKLRLHSFCAKMKYLTEKKKKKKGKKLIKNKRKLIYFLYQKETKIKERK